jgi:class 3 adenylate cyclase
MPPVSFELYAFDGARWSLQQTFAGNQRERAMEMAHETYAQAHIKGVRLMQESYDDASGESSEKTLLTRTKSEDVPKSLNKEIKGPKLMEPPGKAPARKPAPVKPVVSRPVPGTPVPTENAKPKPIAARTDSAAEWARDNAGRLASVVAGSGAVAVGGGLLMAQLPSDAHLLLAIKSVLGTQYILMVAIVLFGMGLAGFGAALLNTVGSGGGLPHALYADQAVPPTGTPGQKPPAPLPKFPVIELEEDEELTPPSTGGLPAEALRLIAFFHDCLVALPRDGSFMKEGKLDAYGWFGCHLFFAGLAAEEARRAGWSPLMIRQIIAIAMTAALSDPRAASRFAARYDEYLTESRYLDMFNRGSDAAMRRAAADPSAAQALRVALEDWHRKQDPAAATGHVAVMFTDIVGSTEFTNTHGDAKHYEMVQAHDRIVRGALQEFTGREIKHTGDGIMAAFDNAALSVHAALRIQRETRAHREVNPDIGMKLRVGVAAGEPIKAGADLFGSTVQLAARMCATAEAEQIIVTEPVREIAAPIGFAFVDLGERPVKGFKQPVHAHAVVER